MYVNLKMLNDLKKDFKPNIGDKFSLVKDEKNRHDSEAIKVLYNHEHIGFIANSVTTVFIGCSSAGRIYDKIQNNQEAEIIIMHDSREIYILKI